MRLEITGINDTSEMGSRTLKAKEYYRTVSNKTNFRI